MSDLSAITKQFDRQAEAFSQMQVVRDERLLQFMVGISGVSAEDSVIDLACGPGIVTMAFAPRAVRAVGVDATEKMIAIARAEAERRDLRNVTFLTGNVEQVPVPDESFDLSVCRFAFHHFQRRDLVLAEMNRIVKPGGKLLVVDMLGSEDPEKAEYHDSLERLCDPSHVRALPLSEFEHMFAEQGLSVLSKVQGETDYSLQEWLDHGGPSDQDAAKIKALMEASLEIDRCGLKVRRESGGLHFTHTGATFLLQKAA